MREQGGQDRQNLEQFHSNNPVRENHSVVHQCPRCRMLHVSVRCNVHVYILLLISHHLRLQQREMSQIVVQNTRCALQKEHDTLRSYFLRRIVSHDAVAGSLRVAARQP